MVLAFKVQTATVMPSQECHSYVRPLDSPQAEAVDAGVYSWPARRADDPLADLRVGVPWSYEDFRRLHLPAYIESTRAYRDEYESLAR